MFLLLRKSKLIIKIFENKIKLEDYVSDIDRYNYILERIISDNIKKHFLKDNGKINIDHKSISDSLFNG